MTKEIVIISGKGGTGKTSITASFAKLGGENIVVADCDVDAADMHLLMQPDYKKREDFYSGYLAEIDTEKCINCNACAHVCRFDAISNSFWSYRVDKLNCEGCGYCEKVCPTDAIKMKENNVGQWFISKTRMNNQLVHAKLGIGAENSGKLVAKVKNEAKNLAKEMDVAYILVDGSPGIGCPVVSSLSGADFVIFVTEPTLTGLHDLKRVHELVKRFRIASGCIINKSDLNNDVTKAIEAFLKEEEIIHINNIPYNNSFSKAIIHSHTAVEYADNEIKNIIIDSWNKVLNILNN